MKSPRETVSLIGPRGSGKTHVGRLLSRSLDLPFVETDALVQEAEGRTPRRIFAEDGEEYFRRVEGQALARALTAPPAVVATGGGAVLDSDNRRLLREKSRVVLLWASPAVLWERIARDPASNELRPPLSELDPLAELEQTLERRGPLYRDSAHLTVSTDGRKPEEVRDEILRKLGNLEPGHGVG
jgi:shikimate kinase